MCEGSEQTYGCGCPAKPSFIITFRCDDISALGKALGENCKSPTISGAPTSLPQCCNRDCCEGIIRAKCYAVAQVASDAKSASDARNDVSMVRKALETGPATWNKVEAARDIGMLWLHHGLRCQYVGLSPKQFWDEAKEAFPEVYGSKCGS